MSRTIAVFGAGTGLGSSVARRFGRDGFDVALVGRREDRLRDLAATLAASGIDAKPFPADLSRPATAPGIVRAIEDALGGIDVVHYGPLSGDQRFSPAAALEVATEQRLLDLFFLTPLALVQAVLPRMIERGDGAVLVSQGTTAISPIPGLSGLGPAMAATRNYIYSLHDELEPKGVYAGTLTVTAGIERSEMFALRHASGADAMTMPSVDPDELAAQLWAMCTARQGPEVVWPPL